LIKIYNISHFKTMPKNFVYRIYTTKGTAGAVRARLTESLVSHGYQQTGNENNILIFRYPSLTFSSKRPLTCVSLLSLEATQKNGEVRVKIGATFTKIRYFTIGIMAVICGVIPVLLSILQRGVVDIPVPAYLGIPLGFMVHYHVRWRVFRAFRRLVFQAGGGT